MNLDLRSVVNKKGCKCAVEVVFLLIRNHFWPASWLPVRSEQLPRAFFFYHAVGEGSPPLGDKSALPGLFSPCASSLNIVSGQVFGSNLKTTHSLCEN